jgi:hypothetical protein
VGLAVALSEWADRPREWYGLGRRDLGGLALFVVRGQGAFDTLSRGRIPSWGAGLTVPGARFIVTRADADDPFRILRHELAHVALHQAVRGRVPLWFDEGYAVVAAGEWDRLDALRLNLTVARGAVPTLAALDGELRSNPASAEAAYALSASAVLFLARRHPSQSLVPLLQRLGAGEPFRDAVLATTGLAPSRLEDAWRREVKRNHGLLLWVLAGGGWAIMGLLVILAVRLRKRRDQPRRAALDEGWVVPMEEPAVAGQDDPAELDPNGPRL